MRFMVFVKATAESEAGIFPDDAAKMFEDMNAFNEQMVKAGIMLAAEGLQPSAKGLRLKFDGTKRTITDGPFAETKELIAGFWILQVKSREEVIEWMKRAPFDGGTEIEIRPVYEAEDFGTALPDSVREAEDRMARRSRRSSSANFFRGAYRDTRHAPFGPAGIFGEHGGLPSRAGRGVMEA